jgi:hypothetical protein
LISVPKIDRGPSDSANVIAVIINQNKHGLHQLGTNYRLIKGWPSSANVKLAASNFLKTDEVNYDRVITLRETVAYISGGQEFSSCICKGQCQTNRCTCFKAAVKCNSRCQNTTNCNNK